VYRDSDHVRASIEMVTRAQAAGDIYKGTYAGWFCTGDNEFKTDSQIVNGRCPDHPTLELQWLEEENYFFSLSRYQGALEQLYRDNPSFCEPEHFRNEVLGWLNDGLTDFSISRAGGTWGIPFPDDPSHRIYVWFDALTNYLTGAGFPDDAAAFERWWPADLHVIGKNITRFHCLYWPAMLMSAGLPLPRQVFAHGFMLMRGERMSKSRGNILDPDSAAALFGVDGVRYVVLREIPFDRDSDVTADGLLRRYNAELANDLGNLVNRTVSMSARYVDHALPPVADADAPADHELQRAAAAAVEAYHAAMGRHHLDEALGAVMDLTSAANGYAESQAPWARSKEGDAARTGAILSVMGEACRILGHLMAPFTPAAAAELHAQLGVPIPYDDRGAGGPGLDQLLAWGSVPAGWQTGDAQPLFPRVEMPADDEAPTGGAP
jgi:methionyl-tRNA synthetase